MSLFQILQSFEGEFMKLNRPQGPSEQFRSEHTCRGRVPRSSTVLHTVPWRQGLAEPGAPNAFWLGWRPASSSNPLLPLLMPAQELLTHMAMPSFYV